MFDIVVYSRLLLEFIAEPGGEDDQKWWGYVFAVSLFLVATLESMCYSHYLYLSLNLGRRISATLTSALYKKVGRKSVQNMLLRIFLSPLNYYILIKKYVLCNAFLAI
jgi:hypothetical protein